MQIELKLTRKFHKSKNLCTVFNANAYIFQQNECLHLFVCLFFQLSVKRQKYTFTIRKMLHVFIFISIGSRSTHSTLQASIDAIYQCYIWEICAPSGKKSTENRILQ